MVSSDADIFVFKRLFYFPCNRNSDNTEQCPIERKKQTNLPEQIKGLVTVIPYSLFENNIKNQSENKLYHGYCKAAEQAFMPESLTAFSYFCKG